MLIEKKHRIRIGVFGGTFDPIHHGHLLTAREALRALDLETILFVPVGDPSHRDPACVTSADHRCAMINAAISGQRRFAISTVDVERPKPTYTFDTLRDLRIIYGADNEFFFIVGGDNLARIPRWYRSRELMTLAHFVGLSRPGYPLTDPGFPQGQLTLLTIRQQGISGTKIRDRVTQGRSITRLVPRTVERYIAEHSLYQSASPSTHAHIPQY
jgi:nicotinate-nucleotide adenylyltransferase